LREQVGLEGARPWLFFEKGGYVGEIMIIALEEHYFDRDWNYVLDPLHHQPRPSNPLFKRMEDLGEQRIREMDEAGVDLQVISHGPPGSQGLREDVAVAWTKAANDGLHQAVKTHPARFASFASLPTTDPEAAADQLERTPSTSSVLGAAFYTASPSPPRAIAVRQLTECSNCDLSLSAE
jgi:predicted TIM-barrel fold metal-dependent hydrolase